MSESILGISAFYHDSAAALIKDGVIVAAAQEERFTRKKHDPSFPVNAVRYVLRESGVKSGNIAAVAFYDKPFLKFERLLETYHCFAPKGIRSFLSSMPVWIKEKLFLKKTINDELLAIMKCKPPKILFPEHHLSHAASAFFPSPFENAAILTIDGVGEWATTTIASGRGRDIKILRQLDFPHSIGLLYSAFTYYCGFKVNSGEYKLMGLAPYGNCDSDRCRRFINNIYDELVDVREDGSILLNMNYFNFATGLTMCNDVRWERLFGITRRKPESVLTQTYMDLAYAIQHVAEDIVVRISETAKKLTGADDLALAGGVALNCVANGKLLRKGIFKNIWIQPAAGDAGGAVGAALASWHIWMKKDRHIIPGEDSMMGAYLGPEFSQSDVKRLSSRFDAASRYYADYDELCVHVADLIVNGNIIGWFQGKMEYGPRALGNRSIIGDARHPEMQKRMNLKIKYREGFRPFAPSVLEEDIENYFELDRPSPYMLLVAPLQKNKRLPIPVNYNDMEMYDRLYHLRSEVPAVTHVDYSARIQSVNRKTNERYWKLINCFKEKTQCGLIVNTSFNVRGEPIVCTPEDAYTCFMRTDMDYLVIGDFIFDKKMQPPIQEDDSWKNTFVLD